MKKQLFIILATTLVATTFVGCSCTGSKTATDTTTESTVESTTPTKNENTTEPEQPTTTVADIETDSNTESTTIEQESTIEAPTEAPTEEPTEQPTEQPTTGNNQQQTLDIKEAYKLTPVGSYTEVEMELDDALKEVLQNTRVVRRTYENGAIRDYMIIDGEEVVLDNPYGVVSDDYKADPNAGAHVSSGEKPTQPQEQEVVYKGIFPPRSNYSSDAEWKAVVNEISNQYSGYGYTFFSSEADAKLYSQLRQGTFTGDSDFINMTTEEWLKWCEENGFTVN